MNLTLFILVSASLIVIPGPNVLYILSTSLEGGVRRGLLAVAGTSSAMMLQLIVAALGTTWLVNTLARGFVWLKWAGVAYLVYLGIGNLLRYACRKVQPPVSSRTTWKRGFLVSLTNPKTILFFSAFLPQFANPSFPWLPQIALLSSMFLLLAAALDSLYAIFAGKLGRWLVRSGALRHTQVVSGGLYLGAGTALAMMRQP